MPMTRHTFRPLLFVLPVFLLLIAVVLVRPTHSSHATSASIKLSLTYGPPTSAVVVSGKGFKGSETVNLTFDTSQMGSVKASKTGSFSGTIAVPSSAQPGNHFVQARGKSSGFFAQASFLVQTDWVQQGFNREHTGYNVFENILNTGNVSQLTQQWVSPPSEYDLGPVVVAGGIVYMSCNELALCALDAATGQLLWSYTTGGRTDGTSPAIANGLIYLGATNGTLYALSATTGQLVWSYDIGDTIDEAPLTANGLVYIGADNGILSALNGRTGIVAWKHHFREIFPTPAIDNGLLYVSA